MLGVAYLLYLLGDKKSHWGRPWGSPFTWPQGVFMGPKAWDFALWDPLNSPVELFAFQGTFCSSGTHPPGWVLWM